MAKKNKAVVFPSGRPPKGLKAAKDATKKTMSVAKEQRRQKKLELRRKEKSKITAAQWAEPAPSHLVARLDMPKVKSKYQSYFEFAENTEKKEKKLEFQITTDPKPPPGFAFVPFGDPVMTNACKELSRERGALIFVVSEAKRTEASKISAEIHRTGYHFREMIVDEAREIVGETVLTRSNAPPGAVEPIPESQEEINKQADLALRDLFPRIPNTDRQMIIEHAFKKGRDFHGEPTVGLQADLPLSRRVQLATLAHIRHTHTRYDKLLRETSWMNARKLVEPVCLDIIVKWRGDEETGRDQLDEILREVVIITDSEDEGDNDSSDDETTDEEGEITDSNPISPAAPTPPIGLFSTHPPPRINKPSRRQNNAGQDSVHAISSRTRSRMQPKTRVENMKHRGFSRYKAAWDEALHRQQGPSSQPTSGRPLNSPTKNMSSNHPGSVTPFSPHPSQPQHRPSGSQTFNRQPDYSSLNQQSYEANSAIQTAPHYHRQHSRVPGTSAPPRNEVTVRQQTDRRINQEVQPRFGTPLQANDQRPPLVVRGSPQRYGLQDMLVPSIETVPSDPIRPLVRSEERRNAYESFDHRQESYPRPVMEVRRPSPQRRQVIILDDDDDAPQYKRRRVHEDESGRFRPHPSFTHPSSTFPSVDSHLISSSSVQTGNFIARDSLIHPGYSQGLSGNADYLFSPAGERIPIYDAPDSGYLGRPTEHFRRPEVYEPREVDGRAPARYNSVPQPSYSHGGEHVYQRPVSHREHMTTNEHNSRLCESNRGYKPVEPEYQMRPQRPQSPSFPVADRTSRYNVASRSDIDQGLIHDFSQSRIEGPMRSGDGFHPAPERSRQVPSQSNPLRGYEEHVSKSSQHLPPTRAISPISYVERPIYHQEQPHRPVMYERRHTDQERYIHNEQVPILVHERTRELHPVYYARPQPPRPQVIVLE